FGLLASLVDFGGLAGAFGLGLFLGRLSLRVGLVLLSLALAHQVVTPGNRAGDFLDLALDTLDDALDGFFGTALVRHGFSLRVAHERPCRALAPVIAQPAPSRNLGSEQ